MPDAAAVVDDRVEYRRVIVGLDTVGELVLRTAIAIKQHERFAAIENLPIRKLWVDSRLRWRRAAFLRAKLRSILSASNEWPKEALRETIGQIIVLQQLLESPYAARFGYSALDDASAISPWQVLYSK